MLVFFLKERIIRLYDICNCICLLFSDLIYGL